MIVTLDADARPDARLPLAAAQQLLADGAVMATITPKFRTSSAASQWLHAAMLVSLVYRHAAGASRATRDSVANGQCMVLRREDAMRDDWCERVRGEIIEDVALVRMLVRDGKHVSMFDGSNLLVVAMFDSFADTWRGWGRSLALGGVDSAPRQWWDALVTFVVLAAPVWLFAAGIATPLTAAAVLLRLGTLVGAHRAYEKPAVGYCSRRSPTYSRGSSWSAESFRHRDSGVAASTESHPHAITNRRPMIDINAPVAAACQTPSAYH